MARNCLLYMFQEFLPSVYTVSLNFQHFDNAILFADCQILKDTAKHLATLNQTVQNLPHTRMVHFAAFVFIYAAACC